MTYLTEIADFSAVEGSLQLLLKLFSEGIVKIEKNN